MKDPMVELQVDSLVGPTHHYSGMSFGNLHAERSKGRISNPKKAFMECLDKAKLVSDLGVPQLIFPPHERPHLRTLRRLGFRGYDCDIIKRAYERDPTILYSVSAPSYMWMANAATVTPACDSFDGRLHITPANLVQNFHRSIEAPFNQEMFSLIFGKVAAVHDFLPSNQIFGDEGAANHQRFTPRHPSLNMDELRHHGIHLFAYGREGGALDQSLAHRYPARQSLPASITVARLHGLREDMVIFANQHPWAIGAGVFHNDVISASCNNFWFLHEYAYTNTEFVLNEVRGKLEALGGGPSVQLVKESELSLHDAELTYIFNSQIVELETLGQIIIAAKSVEEHDGARKILEDLSANDACSVKKVLYVDVGESLANGGGPACLRLRVPIRESELQNLYGNVYLTPKLYLELRAVGEKYYRDQLSLSHLRDGELLRESHQVLDEFSKILGLGNIYDFQK